MASRMKDGSPVSQKRSWSLLEIKQHITLLTLIIDFFCIRRSRMSTYNDSLLFAPAEEQNSSRHGFQILERCLFNGK